MQFTYVIAVLYLAICCTYNVDAQITGLSLAFNPLAALGLGAAGLALAGAFGNRNRGSSRSRGRSYSRSRSYGHRRYGRSIEDAQESVDNLILQAEISDGEDCAKMFICQLNTKDVKDLDETEQDIHEMFGTNEQGSLDVAKTSVRFDLAAMVGREVGYEQCQKLYGKCQEKYDTMLKIVEDQQVFANDL